MTTQPGRRSLEVIGLFAGIGGLDAGLVSAGHSTTLFCENEPAAQAVLQARFPDIPIRPDVREIRKLPKVDLVTGGFPCQDISLAGPQTGLVGSRSGLVWDMFRLIEQSRPSLVLLENVSHLLKLHSGLAMRQVLSALDEAGYSWAYRLVDTRGFGLPQRRLRVVILASRGDVDPASILFAQSVTPKFDDTIQDPDLACMYGFYWTEGKRGVGWARDAVPTIKGGSGLGIPSPPAVYSPRERYAGTPSLADAERLQGFEPGWTDVLAADTPLKPGQRWKLLGNAVSVPVSRWIGEALATNFESGERILGKPLTSGPLPNAAVCRGGVWQRVESTTHVEFAEHEPIGDFLGDPLKPLSPKALTGYLHRVKTGHKRLPDRFVQDLEHQLAQA